MDTKEKRYWEKESKIKGLGYWLLLALSFYHVLNGYGNLEMHGALTIIIIVQMIWNYTRN